jgi:hypothetical protein
MSSQPSSGNSFPPYDDEDDLYGDPVNLDPQLNSQSDIVDAPTTPSEAVELAIQPEQLRSRQRTIYWKVDFSKPELFTMCKSVLSVLHHMS